MKGAGRENPALLITNDLRALIESVVLRCAQRWQIENGVVETVKFFGFSASDDLARVGKSQG
jgi:hypothetical protein